MPEVLFVGTGDAFGSGGRRNSAILIRGRAGSLLLDCGPTTLSGLKDLGVDPREIDAIAISHYHGDHAAGLPFLLLDYLYESRRDRPLDILGPPGIEERLERLTKAFEYDLERPYPVRFSEFDRVGPGATGAFKLTPFAARHHPETCPHMMRVEVDGAAVFFSGDTGWQEELPEVVGDVDLFISEATLLDETFEYHLSCARLTEERSRFACRRMILTHLGSDVLENLDRVPFETARDGLLVKL